MKVSNKMGKQGKFKFLYKDYKPDKKLSEKLLEMFRNTPGETSLTKTQYFFKYNFNVEEAIKGLRKDMDEHPIDRIFPLTLEEMKTPIIGGEVTWLKIPENEKKKIKSSWNKGLKTRRKIMENIYKECHVFKISENIYIAATLVKYEGWRAFIIKTGNLAEKRIYEDDEGRKIEEYGEFRPAPFPSANGKTRIRVIPGSSEFPEQLTLIENINKLTKDLIYEVGDGEVRICSLSLDAMEEALKLISEAKDDPNISSIMIWEEENLYNRELKYAYWEITAKLDREYYRAVVPEFNIEKSSRDPENVKALRKAGWGKWGGGGDIIFISNGFDISSGYLNFTKWEKYQKWKEKTLKWIKENKATIQIINWI